MNSTVFIKPVSNVKKHRDIELVITNSRKNYLVPEPSYHAIVLFLKMH